MTDLKFDLQNTFDANLQEFLMYMDGIDHELTELLFYHLEILQRPSDQARDHANRTEFNKAILDALEATLEQEEGE